MSNHYCCPKCRYLNASKIRQNLRKRANRAIKVEMIMSRREITPDDVKELRNFYHNRITDKYLTEDGMILALVSNFRMMCGCIGLCHVTHFNIHLLQECRDNVLYYTDVNNSILSDVMAKSKTVNGKDILDKDKFFTNFISVYIDKKSGIEGS